MCITEGIHWVFPNKHRLPISTVCFPPLNQFCKLSTHRHAEPLLPPFPQKHNKKSHQRKGQRKKKKGRGVGEGEGGREWEEKGRKNKKERKINQGNWEYPLPLPKTRVEEVEIPLQELFTFKKSF